MPLLLALLGSAAQQASAQTPPRDAALTLYGALRDGGNFVDAPSGRKVGIEASGAAAISLDLGLDVSRQLQFYVSRQRSDLRLDQATASGAPTSRVTIDVTYLHLGGTNFFEGPIGRGAYLVGGLGATLLQPGGGYATELRPSLNIGIGYQLPLGTGTASRIALRLEARGYYTIVNSAGGLFCDGGCTFTLRGDGFTQGEIQLGLSARF